MAIKKIVTYGHPSLINTNSSSSAVSDIDSLIQDLFDTMYANDGVGLAANQININKRIFVVRLL
jgi:peptide deformylase